MRPRWKRHTALSESGLGLFSRTSQKASFSNSICSVGTVGRKFVHFSMLQFPIRLFPGPTEATEPPGVCGAGSSSPFPFGRILHRGFFPYADALNPSCRATTLEHACHNGILSCFFQI